MCSENMPKTRVSHCKIADFFRFIGNWKQNEHYTHVDSQN